MKNFRCVIDMSNADLGLLVTYLERPNRNVMAVIYNVGRSIADHASWNAETDRIRSSVVGRFGLDSLLLTEDAEGGVLEPSFEIRK